MKKRPIIGYIDRDHSDDDLFLDQLGRHLTSLQTDHQPLVLVHGSGRIADEYLERSGNVPERSGSVLTATSPRERALVERGIRQQNKKIVGALTNAVVSSVSIQGSDKRLITVANGEVRIRAAGWIEQLLGSGVLVVLSALGTSEENGEVVEVSVTDVIRALAGMLDADSVLLFSSKNRAFMMREGESVERSSTEDVIAAHDYAEPHVIQELSSLHLNLYLTNFQGLQRGTGVAGTRIRD